MTNQPETPKPDPQTAVSRRSLIKSTAAFTAAGASATFISQLALAQSSNAQESTMTAEEAANVVRRGYHGFNTADLALPNPDGSSLTEWDEIDTWADPKRQKTDVEVPGFVPHSLDHKPAVTGPIVGNAREMLLQGLFGGASRCILAV